MCSIRKFAFVTLLALLVGMPLIGHASKGERIEVVYPLTQVGTSGQKATIEVKATDVSGAPVHGMLVRFTADEASLEKKSDVTDKDGIARVEVVVPPVVGETFTVTATAKDLVPVTATVEVVDSVPRYLAVSLLQDDIMVHRVAPGSAVEVWVRARDQFSRPAPGREEYLTLSINGVQQAVTWSWDEEQYVTTVTAPQEPGFISITVADPVSAWRPSMTRSLAVR